MPRMLYSGVQDFTELRETGSFYVDKTAFLRDWWMGTADGRSKVTLITRPRRFGKTLMMSTVDCFFSTRYAGRADLFEGLDVWNDADMRALQGAYPVIFLSLANVKPDSMEQMKHSFCLQLRKVFRQWDGLLDSTGLNDADRREFVQLRDFMAYADAGESINRLCEFLFKAYGRKTIVLLDEYDTPMQEAWLKGFWGETVEFLRGFFNATFKSNPHLERALLTGVTRVSRESLFSDFNNLRVVTTTTPLYQTSFGFTEEEVFAAMDEYGLTDREGVKAMYDGFTFGGVPDIYNPWSVIGYLQRHALKPYWVNTSGNGLVSRLMREGSPRLKQDCEVLMEGGTIEAAVDEQIVFDDLDGSDSAVWSLLVAAGYLKIVSVRAVELDPEEGPSPDICTLALTNGEVRSMMRSLVSRWFEGKESYGNFLKALMLDDLDGLNEDMNSLAEVMFSYFDTAGGPGAPERFYHGFVLGLLADLRGRYVVTSNRESGRGRYDVMLEPRDPAKDPAFIFEFKVRRPKAEASLEDTVAAAHAQIEAKGYAQQLIERGIPAERIRKYGFAFEGRTVLIG